MIALKKIGLFILLLSNAITAAACTSPTTFQAGPFFSTSLIIRFWQPFTIALQESTACETNIKTSPDYTAYLKNILNKENDIYVVPDHYVSALQDLGYKPILASHKTAQIYFVSRHPLKHGNLKALHGDVITVPSEYTRAYLELKSWLKTNGVFDKVTFDFNHSHDSAAMLMLKGERSSTVILASIYDKLPNFIQDKFSVVKLNAHAGAYLMANETLDTDIINGMIKSLGKLNFQSWHKVETVPDEPYSDEFRVQLSKFKQTHKL